MIDLRLGDLRKVLPTLEADSVDAVVCDPPYELGFMGRAWDASGVAFQPETWRECLRVLKPGGFLLAFGGTRTHHRIGVAVEDAGFEIRDTIAWIYGQGFPKSLNVSEVRPGWGTALKPAFEPIVVGRKLFRGTVVANMLEHGTGALNIDGCRIGTTKDVPASPRRAEQGPAYGDLSNASGDEPGFDPNVGRWPANVMLGHSEDCVLVGQREVRGDGNWKGKTESIGYEGGWDTTDHPRDRRVPEVETIDEWDCVEGCPVRLLDEQSGTSRDGVASGRSRGFPKDGFVGGSYSDYDGDPIGYGGAGGASRFFYCTKASRAERDAGLEGFDEQRSEYRRDDDPEANTIRERLHGSRPRKNHHPTVKPVAVMRWLCRLVTPPGGTVLDPFLGSGTTGIAAVLEGFGFVGVELGPEYLPIADARIAFWQEHGEDTLRIVAERDLAERRRVVVAETGQLDLLS